MKRKLIIDAHVAQYNLISIPGIDIVYSNEDPYFTFNNKINDDDDIYLLTGINSNYVVNSGISNMRINNIMSYKKVIPMLRVKDTDKIMMSKYHDIIDTPTTYFSNNFKTTVNMLENDKEYIVKVTEQARSIGKHVFKDKYEIMHYLNVINGETEICDIDDISSNKFYDVVNEYFNINVGRIYTDDEKYLLHKQVIQNRVVVQEVVEFSHEFRILYFKGTESSEFVVENRIGYSPSSEEERKHEVVDLSDIIPEQTAKLIKEKCKLFGDSLSYVMLSLDIYYNEKDDTFGMFEYSQQFGVDYEKDIIEKISKQMSNAVYNEIKCFT